MAVTLQNTSEPPVYRQALVLCCDEKYLPFAALAVHTALRTNPDREFDICIVSEARLETPPALTGHGVRMCQVDVGDAFKGFPTSERFSAAAYLRLILPHAFQDAYDRILYIDCDVFAVGEALNELFTVDLCGKPIGAVSDNMKWKYPKRPTPDQAKLGINGPYFNSGVLLMDCKSYIAADVLGACVKITNEYDPDKLYFDQTVLNLALEGKWASLHPAWNWQWPIVRPLFEMFVDVQLVHFVSPNKPWSDLKGNLSVRYRQTARRFLTRHYPDLAFNSAEPATTLKKSNLVARLFKHITRGPAFVYRFNQHGGDISRVLADP